MGVIATVTGTVTGSSILSYNKIIQETCPHDAKVKMPGYDNMYECTRCHKFIHTVTTSKEKEPRRDETAPKYAENGWEDDYDD